jgi:hypothetical protein
VNEMPPVWGGQPPLTRSRFFIALHLLPANRPQNLQ